MCGAYRERSCGRPSSFCHFSRATNIGSKETCAALAQTLTPVTKRALFRRPARPIDPVSHHLACGLFDAFKRQRATGSHQRNQSENRKRSSSQRSCAKQRTLAGTEGAWPTMEMIDNNGLDEGEVGLAFYAQTNLRPWLRHTRRLFKNI